MIIFSQLESCGLIEQRLNIHAQEDVYSMAKTKVTEYQKIEDSTKKQFVFIQLKFTKIISVFF